MGRTPKEDIMQFQSLPEEIYRSNDGRYFIKAGSNVHCLQCSENYVQPASKLARIIKCEKCGGINTISVNEKPIISATVAVDIDFVTVEKKPKVDFFTPEDNIEVNKELSEKAKSEKNLPDFLRLCSFKKYFEIYSHQSNLPLEEQLLVLQISIERNIKKRLDYLLGMKNFKQIPEKEIAIEKTQQDYEEIIANLNKEVNSLKNEMHTFREESNTNFKEIRNTLISIIDLFAIKLKMKKVKK
jgi:hypothetical protein